MELSDDNASSLLFSFSKFIGISCVRVVLLLRRPTTTPMVAAIVVSWIVSPWIIVRHSHTPVLVVVHRPAHLNGNHLVIRWTTSAAHYLSACSDAINRYKSCVAAVFPWVERHLNVGHILGLPVIVLLTHQTMFCPSLVHESKELDGDDDALCQDAKCLGLTWFLHVVIRLKSSACDDNGQRLGTWLCIILILIM